MGKVFNYIRVSTKEQNEERQIKSMEEFNKSEGITNAIQLIDKATGTNTNREQLQLMLKVVGKGDLVVIKSIDRLSRNYKECIDLWQQITKSGADIVVLDMKGVLDTRQYKDLLGDLISNLFINILGYVAQQETEFRKQRQEEGMASMPSDENGKKYSKKTGRYTGRPKAEYPQMWEEYYTQWKNGDITAKTCMESLELKRTTFYKLVKEYEEEQ